jgi:2-polyprenyl-6-methoxyphenol hydroxylase-like FAD-dependent oxidoreductase
MSDGNKERTMERPLAGDTAIVIGGSIAGMLTARVLSAYFAQVVIFERDDLAVSDKPRKGIPHAQHAHALLPGGLQAIEALFPGMAQQLVAEGAVRGHGRFFSGGGYHARMNSGPGGLFVSRPLLETAIRACVRTLPNVTVADRIDVQGLASNEHEGRVTGVRIVRRDDSEAVEAVAADLVVDCSGRGSRATAWLEQLGYQPPEVERVEVDMGYSTRIYRREPGHLGGDVMINVAPLANNPRACGMMAQEGDRWIVTLAGYFGDYPPTDEAGYLDFSQRLPISDVHDLIRSAETLSAPISYRFRANQWRHFERLDRFPDGFLVLGDAIASFTPIYGQGMSVAALEARALERCLAVGSQHLASRFFAEASKIVGVAWSITVGNDKRLSKQPTSSPAARLLGWYMARLQIAARHDPAVAAAFMQVGGFLAPPPTLLRPAIAWRVFRGNLPASRRRRETAVPMSQPART